jgi:seryl-tRNA synthetase
MKKIFEDFRKGIEKVRWFAKLFAERLKIEIAVFRLLYDADRMNKTREKLLKKIGERVMELKEHHDKNIFRDTTIAEALGEIEKLEKNMEETRAKVSDIGRVTE